MRRVLTLFTLLAACGETAPPPATPRPLPRIPQTEESPPPEAPAPLPPRYRPDPGAAGEQYPASLLRPIDGFPLPSGARMEDADRDLAEYRVEADLAVIEGFYRERGFQVVRPRRMQGLIVTRGDSGTRLQVQPGPHRAAVLRFFR